MVLQGVSRESHSLREQIAQPSDCFFAIFDFSKSWPLFAVESVHCYISSGTAGITHLVQFVVLRGCRSRSSIRRELSWQFRGLSFSRSTHPCKVRSSAVVQVAVEVDHLTVSVARSGNGNECAGNQDRHRNPRLGACLRRGDVYTEHASDHPWLQSLAVALSVDPTARIRAQPREPRYRAAGCAEGIEFPRRAYGHVHPGDFLHGNSLVVAARQLRLAGRCQCHRRFAGEIGRKLLNGILAMRRCTSA